jgi:hypothetical protein
MAQTHQDHFFPREIPECGEESVAKLGALVIQLLQVPSGSPFPGDVADKLVKLLNECGYPCCECVPGGKSCKEYLRDTPYAFLLGLLITVIQMLQDCVEDER